MNFQILAPVLISIFGIIGLIMAIVAMHKSRQCWCYPYYGPAPHNVDKSDWPDNFEEDPEHKNLGKYYCPCNNKYCQGKK